VEAVTGADLSGVQVFTGGASADAAGQLGASAYAADGAVHFGAGQYAPGTPTGDHLLAHELAHVAQGPELARKGGDAISQPGQAAEVEADRIADAAVAGSGQRIEPQHQAAPVARATEQLTGNPAELTDSAGTATTAHRAPNLADSVNAPSAAAAGQQTRASNMRIVAGAANPVRDEPPATPAAETIYEEGEAVSPAPSGFTAVTGFNGTLAAPQVQQTATNDVFINGQVSPDDVQQSGIGDCYFLATLMSVSSRDPGKLLDIITPDGNGGATVKLWRADAHTPNFWERLSGTAPERDWTQVDVVVSDQLAFNVSDNKVHGAQLRCAPNPMASEHWAALEANELAIHRREEFACARWAPLLEKAYARFSQAHDNYGGARTGGSTATSGYAAINGGWSHKSMAVLYGPEADKAGTDLKQNQTNWAPGGDVVMSNLAVMEQLLLLQGRGDQTTPGESDAPIVTATAMVNPLIGRLAAAIPVAQGDPDWANVDATRQGLVAQIGTNITAWQALASDPAPPAPQPKATARNGIATACVNAVAPGLTDSSVQQAQMAYYQRTSPVQFGEGSAAVAAADQARLATLNHHLSFYTNPQVEVKAEGRANTVGNRAQNQTLSAQRATAVEALVSGPRSIGSHTTVTEAHGEQGAGPEAEWRRVDITATSTGHASNTLLDDARSAPIRAATDLMLDLRNAGTDASTGQRNIYGDHVYSVVGVNLVTSTGDQAPIHLIPAPFRPLVYPLVDPDQSIVTLRNPHHGNEPDRRNDRSPTRPGDGAPSGAQADGTFTMTLSEFFRNYTSVESGVFPRT
jgi:outer membrane protein OmpA-like peptidoglycan-associated protein